MSVGAFTPDAARKLGGPEWLAERRDAAAERLASVAWPTPAEEIWRYSRINELDLERYRPFVEAELGRAGVTRRNGAVNRTAGAKPVEGLTPSPG